MKVRSDEYDEKDDDERRMRKRRGAERKGRRNKLKHGRSSSSRTRRHHHATCTRSTSTTLHILTTAAKSSPRLFLPSIPTFTDIENSPWMYPISFPHSLLAPNYKLLLLPFTCNLHLFDASITFSSGSSSSSR